MFIDGASRMSKNLRRFKIRKYGIIFLFSVLMCTNVITLMQSFQGEMFAHVNGLLCLVRFLLYGQLLRFRVKGQGPYTKFILAIIIVEVISFIPQLLLDFEILEITQSMIYYVLLDAFGQGLLIFLLIDEYVYVQSLNEDISTYQKMLKDNELE